MTRDEAFQLVAAIADSLAEHPDQFHLTVIGAYGVGQPGGIGMAGIGHGGGTGIRVEASGGGVEIRKAGSGGAVTAELTEVVATLRELASDLATGKDDNYGRLVERLNQYAAFPASLLTVVNLIVSLVAT